MKRGKLLALILAGVMTLGLLSACGVVESGADTDADAKQETVQEPEISEETMAPAIVATTAGQVRGTELDGVYQFLGVPYAEAKGRFLPAEAVTPWEGVRDADDWGAISPQTSFFGGSADGQDNNCQNLNLWTPGTGDAEKRPVMVWFHGGMTSGSANGDGTSGANLAKAENVVVVTVNHRLGVLGYLDLSAYGEQYAQSGNVGALDMVASLQWIHDNIAAFGGDPENVTAFGQSGGGAKVLALMTTPYAKGLLHKGINESGATDTLGPVFATKEMNARVAELTLETLNITAENLSDLETVAFETLNEAGTQALAQVAEEFQIESPFGGSYAFEWMPEVDGDVIPSNPVLDDGFAENAFDIPLLIGTNLNEWQFAMNVDADMDENAVLAQLRETYGDDAEAVLAAFQEAYPGVAVANALYVDAMLRPPILKITAHKAQQGGAPVYSYVMTYGAPGATHGAEIPLVFRTSAPENAEMSDIMSAIWAQFARTGAPTVEGLPQWEPYDSASGATMILDTESHLAYHHDAALLELLKPGYIY